MARYTLQYLKEDRVNIYKGLQLYKAINATEVYSFLNTVEDNAVIKIDLTAILSDLSVFKKPRAKYQVVIWGNGMAGIYQQKANEVQEQVCNTSRSGLGVSLTHYVPNNAVIKVLKGANMLEFKKTRHMLTVMGQQM